MRILYKLAYSHLKKHKNQTFITLIGIILSVTLITSIFTFMSSCYTTIRTQNINENGYWHYFYNDIDALQKAVLDGKDYVKETFPLVMLQQGKTDGMESPNYYVHLYGTDTIGFKNLPIHMKEGVIPKNADEIVISESLTKLYPSIYQIGKMVSIDLGGLDNVRNSFTYEKSQIFRITGTYADVYRNSNELSIFTFSDVSTIDPTTKISVYVIDNNISKDMFNRAKNFGLNENGEFYKPHFNAYLLSISGVRETPSMTINVLIMLTTVLVLIVVAGSVALIYNGFSMAATELTKQLGLLSSVGATKAQKRWILLTQGLILAIIGILIGMILGLSVILILIRYINANVREFIGTEGLLFSINELVILGIILLSLFTVFLSAFLPAIQVTKNSAIELIRQNNQIKLPKRAKKTSFVLNKLGFEAQLSYKNIKRFSKRYRTTRFSIILSIVLYLVVIGFSTLITQSRTNFSNPINYDISVNYYLTTATDNAIQFYQKVAKLSSVNDYSIIKIQSETTDSTLLTKDVLEKNPNLESQTLGIVLVVMDDVSLTKYLTKIGADKNVLSPKTELMGILVNRGSLYDQSRKIFVEVDYLNVKVGDKVPVTVNNISETNQDRTIVDKEFDLKLAAITDVMPIGMNSSIAQPILIISQTTWDTMLPNVITNSTLFIKTDDPNRCGTEIQALHDNYPVGELSLYNDLESNAQSRRITAAMFLFLFIFIGIVAIISIANILNSVYTSIHQRRRELAMLKSVGMTNRNLYKMLGYESFFYAISAIIIAFPVGLMIDYLLYKWMNVSRYVEFEFIFPYFQLIIILLFVIFIIYLTMLYSLKSLQGENIIDQLKDETI